MAESVPSAVQSCHELLLWLIPQLDKFPRIRRFTLGEQLENDLLGVLAALVETHGCGTTEKGLAITR